MRLEELTEEIRSECRKIDKTNLQTIEYGIRLIKLISLNTILKVFSDGLTYHLNREKLKNVNPSNAIKKVVYSKESDTILVFCSSLFLTEVLSEVIKNELSNTGFIDLSYENNIEHFSDDTYILEVKTLKKSMNLLIDYKNETNYYNV